MFGSFRSNVVKTLRVGVLGAFLMGPLHPAYATVPLPVLDIVPESSFTTTEDDFNTAGGPRNPAATNGDIELTGTATEPITRAFSLSYDRLALGTFDSALAAVPIGPINLYPGGSRDVVQNYRADYRLGRINIEGGLASRHRRCCPAGSFEWHKGFLGVSYATPPIPALLHSFFVLDIRGNTDRHVSSPQVLAALPPGLSERNGANARDYTTQQAVTIVVPVQPRSGVRFAGTFLWGALDYPVDYPFPIYYDVFILAGTKQVSENFGVTVNLTNVKQRLQGYPFPPPGFIATSALNVLADFHIDFNKFVTRPVNPGPPTQPGAPGGPGGPAQVGPTQGGSVSPSPSASGSPAQPGASPGPAMPGASPAPMTPPGPAPSPTASP